MLTFMRSVHFLTAQVDRKIPLIRLYSVKIAEYAIEISGICEVDYAAISLYLFGWLFTMGLLLAVQDKEFAHVVEERFVVVIFSRAG